jgi:hypothetical protein
MSSKKVLCFVILACSCGLAHWDAEEAQAQGYRRGEYRRYVPRRPTFGDAFNYARDDVGLLTEYHTFVMPQRQLRNTLRQQEDMIRAQEGEIADLETRLQESVAPITPTGKGGRYMSYSHFYTIRRQR